MTTSRWLLIITVLVLVADGVLIGQRCMHERRLTATTMKADTQLVETTQQLATEHKEQARTQAKATVRAAQRQVVEEVTHEEASGDLADYLDAAVRAAGSGGD